jgi:hypothetical protein
MTDEPNVFCDYHSGMFAFAPNSELQTTDAFDHFEERRVVAYHEAGHAVLQFALDAGLSRIALRTSIVKAGDGPKIAYSGICFPRRQFNAQVLRLLDRKRFHDSLIIHGVTSAAGPAAERKFCLSSDARLRTYAGSAEDHQHIFAVACMMDEIGQDGTAYQEMVWRRAQLAFENEAIWDAVNELALYLDECFWPEDEEYGEHECTMPGPKAHAVIRRAGVVRGMKLDLEDQ